MFFHVLYSCMLPPNMSLTCVNKPSVTCSFRLLPFMCSKNLPQPFQKCSTSVATTYTNINTRRFFGWRVVATCTRKENIRNTLTVPNMLRIYELTKSQGSSTELRALVAQKTMRETSEELRANKEHTSI